MGVSFSVSIVIPVYNELGNLAGGGFTLGLRITGSMGDYQLTRMAARS